MKEQNTTKRISICMGSSCFPRGNNRNIEIIQRYLSEPQAGARIELQGCLCHDQCKDGPNIRIDEKMYQQVDPAAMVDILKHETGKVNE